MQLLTSTELSAETDTGVIVTLAVRPVDAPKAGRMTHTLATIALTLTVAYLRLIVCEAVTRQSALLIAFTLFSQEPRLTHANAALESPLALGAQAAVRFVWLLAVTRAKRLQFHLQSVL